MNEESTQRHPGVPPAICQELTRRATNNILWAEYLLLISACGEILSHAPDTAQACENIEIEERLGEDLACLARTIDLLLPGGFAEFRSYLGAATRQRAGLQSSVGQIMSK